MTESEAIRKALARGERIKPQLLQKAGGILSLAEAADQLGVGQQAVRQRIEQGTLIGMEQEGEIVVPKAQFDESGRELAGLREILEAMTINSPWMRLDWLLTPEPRMSDQIPIDLLRRGESIDDLAQCASLFGVHGAA